MSPPATAAVVLEAAAGSVTTAMTPKICSLILADDVNSSKSRGAICVLL